MVMDRIQALVLKDGARVVALEQRIVEESRLLGVRIGLSYEFLSNPLAIRGPAGSSITLGAEDDAGELIGVISARLETVRTRSGPRRSAYLHGLRVAPSARGRGLGTELVRRMCDAARRTGAECCWGAVSAGNSRSASAGQRAGFHLIGRVFITAAPLAWRFGPDPFGSNVREATPGDDAAIATLFDRFYAGLQLSPIDRSVPPSAIQPQPRTWRLLALDASGRPRAALTLASLKDAVRPRLSTRPAVLLGLAAPLGTLLGLPDPRRPLRVLAVTGLAWNVGEAHVGRALLEAARRQARVDHDLLMLAWDAAGPMAPLARRVRGLRSRTWIGADDLELVAAGLPCDLRLI